MVLGVLLFPRLGVGGHKIGKRRSCSHDMLQHWIGHIRVLFLDLPAHITMISLLVSGFQYRIDCLFLFERCLAVFSTVHITHTFWLLLRALPVISESLATLEFLKRNQGHPFFGAEKRMKCPCAVR